MKINLKYKSIVFAFLMAFSMSLFISFILSSINLGYSDSSLFLHSWLKTWSQAFICAFFGAYFFPKGIQRVMKKIHFVDKTN
ncbi:hypothetical protein PCCS19_03280 [Paenibacillus sp. CCS19]|uniref:DUF2798 domain-containing protein n=1 Tax=Paenibacillus sp. CCS19 TaxID=3158387 RepID=UPI00255FCB76|nr:DUF2798 domain-containing protein [Paenibacillus cellulosilyticus]GMK37275.1 hypothetical protein PCCS19_03280 [Paenibacillus cellulosilyticus]